METKGTAVFRFKLLSFAFLLFVVLFWRLGAPTFWDPDEAHYAETTRELIRSGDSTTPYYNESPFFDKPILFHLLQSIPMRIIGPTEFAARLVPAIAAAALVAITGWLAATLTTADVAELGALLVAVSPGLFALARYAILDTVFTAFLFGGASLVTVAAFAPRGAEASSEAEASSAPASDRAVLQWPGYGLIALAVLVKGPLAIALCGVSFVLAIAISPEARRRLLALHWVAGLALVAVISAPWFLWMWHRWDRAFVDGYVLNENVRLFGTSMYANQPGFTFYLQILAVGLLPWTGLLLGRIFDDVRCWLRRDSPDTLEVLLLAWSIAIVGFFTLSKFKLDHYVFPATPALCLLCARAWSDARRSPGDPRHAGARVGMWLVGPLLVTAGVGVGYFLLVRFELPAAAMIVPVALLAAGAWITARLSVKGPERVPAAAFGALAITYAAVLLWVLPALEQRKVVPDLARFVASHASATDRVAAYQMNRWNTAFRFYVDRHLTQIESPGDARDYFSQADPFYCAMPKYAYDDLAARGVPLRVVYARAGMTATSGRVLWRRQVPSTEFVIVTRSP